MHLALRMWMTKDPPYSVTLRPGTYENFHLQCLCADLLTLTSSGVPLLARQLLSPM